MNNALEEFMVNLKNDTEPSSFIENGNEYEIDDNNKTVLTSPAQWILIIVGIIVGFVVIAYLFRKFIQGPFYWKNNRINGKVVIVTGCNTGIGKETVLELAKRGAKIYMACRDPNRCEAARLEIIEKSKNENIFNRTLDLSSLESVKKFADTFHKEENRLDILINNAGVMACPKMFTKDGFELQIGINHLGHFYLTNLLLDTIKASAPSRIIVVSSTAYLVGRINKNDLMSEKSYSRARAYAQSKLANILFSNYLAEKLEGTGVTVNSCHPGVVKTELGRYLTKTEAIKLIQGPFYWKNNRIDGKVVIVTGCNTGIGKETVLELAKRGAKIYMACRDPIRCEAARLEIIEKSKNENIFNRTLDLSSLESVNKFADTFHKEENRLDILINNAGVMACPKMFTKDGFELQIGTNHLGHFYLTKLLLETLKASAPSRIIVVASSAHLLGRIKKDDIMSEKSYSRARAYAQSKLANILFSNYLAKKLEGTGVTVNSCHPGVVQTELARHLYNSKTKFLFQFVGRSCFKTPKAGAQTQLRLALDPSLEKISGKFYFDCIRAPVLPKARDKEMMEWLWNKSEELIESKLIQNEKQIEEVNNKNEKIITTLPIETIEIQENTNTDKENQNNEINKNKNSDAIVIEVTNEK